MPAALAVFIPVCGSFLLPFLGRWTLIRNLAAFFLVLASFVISLMLLPATLAGGNTLFYVFNADVLAVFMALVSSFIGLIIVLYSFDYISHYDNQNEYYLMVVLFLGAMMGLIYSNHLLALYLFWEITAIACWRLIGFYRGKPDVLKADKAFLVTFFGAVVMLIGFIFIYQLTGTFIISDLRGWHVPGMVTALILFGILSKSATLPFHTWLPDAGVAPSPVTALLHAAVLVKIGVYVFARLFVVAFALGNFWHVTVPVIAAVSALVAAGAALIETDLKRIIAYSTISQIGFIFLGLSVGGWMGAVGGLLYILMHGLAKGGLFLCAGIIEQNAKTKDITKMGGLIQTMPFTALSFLFCAFSVMGIPPFGGFFSKYLVIAGAVWGGQKLLALTFILGAFLTILYLFRLFNLIFLGERKGEAAREGSNLMVFCVALLAGLSLLGGLLVNFPLDYLLHLSGQSTYLGIEALFRLDHFSGLMVGAILGFSALIFLYSLSFMRGKPAAGQFYLYFLLTAIFACGAVLSDNLILFLFFWEGLLLTLFGLIYIGGKNSFKTAIKAFIIVGISDLCLMLGIAWVGQLAGTFEMSKISLSLAGGGAFAFILMMIGALAKGGSMPFHTWIPDAALDAPLPFMALVPGALEKLLGIYLLARLCLEMFRLDPSSWLSPLLMTIGGLTIILAVLMALIQKDFKRLLSYHAISQVGYMVLGIGTALPIGIIGGLFHMVNNALYKSCLFLTGGAVEKQAGTTDLSKLGGLMRQMPITFICFFIAALSISGVPPFNGFFSKELIYDAALERGWIFYLFAVGGSFFTAASFLKLGHAAFLGKSEVKAKEAPWPMLLPMLALAFICVFFGVYNALPIDQLTKSVFSASVHTEPNFWLIGITILVLIGAVLNHIYGVRKTGKGIGAVDHIHYAPGMHGLFKQPDPYDIGMKFAGWVSLILYRLDRLVDWVYEVFTVNLTRAFTRGLKWMHSGNYSNYVVWSLVGAALVVLMVVR